MRRIPLTYGSTYCELASFGVENFCGIRFEVAYQFEAAAGMCLDDAFLTCTAVVAFLEAHASGAANRFVAHAFHHFNQAAAGQGLAALEQQFKALSEEGSVAPAVQTEEADRVVRVVLAEAIPISSDLRIVCRHGHEPRREIGAVQQLARQFVSCGVSSEEGSHPVGFESNTLRRLEGRGQIRIRAEQNDGLCLRIGDTAQVGGEVG